MGEVYPFDTVYSIRIPNTR